MFETGGQRIRMLRAHRCQGAEHNGIQGALEQFDAVGAFTSHSGGVRAAVSHPLLVRQVEWNGAAVLDPESKAEPATYTLTIYIPS